MSNLLHTLFGLQTGKEASEFWKKKNQADFFQKMLAERKHESDFEQVLKETDFKIPYLLLTYFYSPVQS